MHESPSHALKAFITSPSPGKWEASASHLPQPYTRNSLGNFLSLPRKHDLQNYTSDSSKALHGTSDFSFQGLMTDKCASTMSFTIWFYFNPSLGEGNGNPLQYSCLENPMDGGAWWAAVHGVARSRTRLRDFTFTFHFHALEKEMETHSSVLAWRIPGTGEPGGLPSMGSHRVGHDWSDLAAAVAVTPHLINICSKQEGLLCMCLPATEHTHQACSRLQVGSIPLFCEVMK